MTQSNRLSGPQARVLHDLRRSGWRAGQSFNPYDLFSIDQASRTAIRNLVKRGLIRQVDIRHVAVTTAAYAALDAYLLAKGPLLALASDADKLRAAKAVLSELVNDVEVLGVEIAEEDWPDIVPTYRKAKALLSQLS